MQSVITQNNRTQNRYRAKDHTFVICAYGKSMYLEECIESVLKQEVRGQVCMATSTPNDFLKEMAQKYDLPLYVNPVREGIAADWNFAVACADTPLVTLVHQDDVYCSGYCRQILAVLNSCNIPLIAFTDYYELRKSEIVKKNKLLQIKRFLLFPLKFRILWKNIFIRRRILSLGSAICCPSVTLVKENLNIPVFQNNMKSNIDWQAWEEISRKIGEFVYLSQPLMMHRIHQESTTSKILAQNSRREEDIRMYQKFWPAFIAKTIELFYQKAEESNRG